MKWDIKTDIILKLHFSLSKIFAFMITFMAFVLSLKFKEAHIFLTVVPIAAIAVGVKQYFDKHKDLKNATEPTKTSENN